MSRQRSPSDWLRDVFLRERSWVTCSAVMPSGAEPGLVSQMEAAGTIMWASSSDWEAKVVQQRRQWAESLWLR